MRIVLLSALLAMGLAGCTSSEPESSSARSEPSAAAEPSNPAAPTDSSVAAGPPAATVPSDAVPGPTPATATSYPIYHYQCSDNSVHVTFDGYQAATVVIGGLPKTLPLVASDSGMRYADGTGNEFFSTGGSEAQLRLKGEGMVMCSGQAEESVPEVAPTRKEFPLARAGCLDAVARETNVDRAKLEIVEVMGSRTDVAVTIKVPGTDVPWSCLSGEDGKVDGVVYMEPEGGP